MLSLELSRELLHSTLTVAEIYCSRADSKNRFLSINFNRSILVNNFPAFLLPTIASSICFYFPTFAFIQLEPWAEDDETTQERRFTIISVAIVNYYFVIAIPYMLCLSELLRPRSGCKMLLRHRSLCLLIYIWSAHF